MEEISTAIENLKRDVAGFRQRISACRKKGLDTSIAELRVMAIPPKISMADVTKDYKDLQKANELMYAARAEIEGIEKEGLNSKENSAESGALEEALALMDRIESLLKEGNSKEARAHYLKCVEIYKKLPEKNKQGIFKRLDKLRDMITRG